MKLLRIIIFSLFFLIPSTMFSAQLPPAQSKKYMVVTSQHIATNVGLSILKQGGNAVDAAVAVGYALAVVHPCCGNIGGGGFMLLHRKDGENIFIDFREKAPSAISNKLFLNPDGSINKKKRQYGYLPVGIPGTVLGLNTALKQYGTMSLSKVMQPAIQLANKGFILQTGDVKILDYGIEYFRQESNAAQIFLHKDRPYRAGERLRQPLLGKVLYSISQKGSEPFYHGWIAKAIVKSSQESGGVLQLKDFANYQVEIRKPIHCQYRGYDIFSAPPPSSGVTLCEILNILNGYSLGDLGYHAAASTNYILEAMRYGFADRYFYLGDPDLVSNPINRLLSPDYAAKIRQKIIPNKAGNSIPKVSMRMRGNTTHYVILDHDGNAVSLTYTLNSFFGSKMIAKKTGFFLNNELSDFVFKANQNNKVNTLETKNLIAPNKRPLSAMIPTFVFKDGKIFMLLGAAGGPTIITTVLQTILHVIDDQMDINSALNAPRYHMQWIPDLVYVEPFCFSKDTLIILQGMGYQFHPGAPWKTRYWGQGAAILVDPKTGMIYGANDNRYPAGLAKGA